ncbi:MAG: CatB-related O-acetyltransferase [Roseibium sp.]
MHGPSPDTLHPLNGEPHTVFLKNVITRSNIEVGDFTYFHDDNHPTEFENRNVRYHFDFNGDKLKIGKFCALASGTTFIMNGANHALSGFSTYPFFLFGNGWEEGFDFSVFHEETRGDTIVEHDVWFGTNSVIMPGVTICSGAVIGAHSVVASDVPPYSIAVGNPARVIKLRYDEETIDRLLAIGWWNWPADKISRSMSAIQGADLAELETIAKETNVMLDAAPKAG